MKPKLRFKEFTDDWEEKKLGDFMNFANGINTDKNNYGTGRKMISVLDVLNDSKLLSKNIINSVNISKEMEEKYKVTYGDIIFVRSSEVISEVGLCKGYVDKKNYSLYSGFTIRGNQSIYHPIVLQNIINVKARREIEKQAGGSTRYNVSQSILKNIKIQLPSLPEQEKIGKFFSLLDERIEKQERKVALLEEEKKGYMQQIFNQELRFKDEEGNNYPDWEEKKLGKIAEIKGGGTPSTENEEYWNGRIPWFTPSEIGYKKYISESNRNITEKGLQKSSAKLLPKNTLLLTSRATLGEMSILKSEGSTNQGFQSLIVNKQNSYEFIYYLQYRIKKYCYKYASGSTFLEISKSQLSKCKLQLPSLPEQEKIANFLSLLDQRIEKEQEKLRLLKEEKKGLLQQMFV